MSRPRDGAGTAGRDCDQASAVHELDRLTADEVEALRDLFCACVDLRHELPSDDALRHRVDQTLSKTARYTER